MDQCQAKSADSLMKLGTVNLHYSTTAAWQLFGYVRFAKKSVAAGDVFCYSVIIPPGYESTMHEAQNKIGFSKDTQPQTQSIWNYNGF